MSEPMSDFLRAAIAEDKRLKVRKHVLFGWWTRVNKK